MKKFLLSFLCLSLLIPNIVFAKSFSDYEDLGSSTVDMPYYLDDIIDIPYQSTYDYTCPSNLVGYCNYNQTFGGLFQDLKDNGAIYTTVYRTGNGSSSYYTIMFTSSIPIVDIWYQSGFTGSVNSINDFSSWNNYSRDIKFTFDNMIGKAIHINTYNRRFTVYDLDNIDYFWFEGINDNGTIYTNYDLYNTNEQFIKDTDVVPLDYVSIPPRGGVSLIPKINSAVNTYISYNNSSVRGGWYFDNNNLGINAIGIEDFENTISSTLKRLSYPASYYNNAKYNVVNLSYSQNLRFGYDPNYFDIVIYDDFTGSGVDNNNHTVSNNPLQPLADFSNNRSFWDAIKDGMNGINNSFGNLFEGINSGLSSIADTISNLADGIVNGITTSLSNLFIPSNSYFTGLFNGLYTEFSTQFGFLTYPFEWIATFLNRFLNITDTGHYVISWNNIKVPNFNENIITAGSYDLATLLEDNNIKTMHDFYLLFVDAILIIAFLNLCLDKFHDVFGGSSLEHEDLTKIKKGGKE